MCQSVHTPLTLPGQDIITEIKLKKFSSVSKAFFQVSTENQIFPF